MHNRPRAKCADLANQILCYVWQKLFETKVSSEITSVDQFITSLEVWRDGSSPIYPPDFNHR